MLACTLGLVLPQAQIAIAQTAAITVQVDKPVASCRVLADVFVATIVNYHGTRPWHQFEFSPTPIS